MVTQKAFVKKKGYMGKSKTLSWNAKCLLCISLSFVGTMMFFIIPFIRILYYSIIDNQFRRNFVGLSNYIKTLNNEYFLLALKNSLLLIAICIPTLIILALFITLILTYGINRLNKIRTAFILPMFIPTASIVLVWQILFSDTSTVLPLYLLFIWKNIGICIILITAALTSIEKEIYESAYLEGSTNNQLYRYITIPLISPTIFFSILLSIVNSFKIYKESYLFYGENYPPEHSYTLQYYINNNFLKLDYQALATSSVLTMILIMSFVVTGLELQRRFCR